MKHLLGSIRIALVAGGVLFGTAAMADAPKPDDPKPAAKAKPRKPGQTDAIKKAIEELTKEYKEYLAKPEDTILRTTSDYFKGELPEGTTVEDILTVCSGSLPGPVGQQAYIKWQLMSACPLKFESDQVKMALTAYNRAPALVPGVAGSPQVKAELDRLIQGKKGDEVPREIIDAFKKKQQEVDDINLAIIGYRKALLQRLPTTYDTLLLNFQEFVHRLNAGAVDKSFSTEVKQLTTEVNTWAAVDAKEGQATQLIGVVQKLKAYKAPVTYYAPTIRTGDKAAKWDTIPVSFGKNLDELETSLKEISSGSGGGIRFKEDKDTKKK